MDSYYDRNSEENSSASGSDYDNLDYEYDNYIPSRMLDNDNDDVRSDISYGENLRVRSWLPPPLEYLVSNDSEVFSMTSRMPLKETSDSEEISLSARPFHWHPSPVYTLRGSG